MRDEVVPIARNSAVVAGKPHVEGHRIAVHHVASWYRRGASAEELARDYRRTPGEVHAALAYYDHQAEIDDELAREAAEHAARAAADDSPIARRIREAIAERTRRQAHE